MLNHLRSCFTRLHKDESGQGLVEYSLVVALLVFAAVASMSSVASEIDLVFTKIQGTLQNALS